MKKMSGIGRLQWLSSALCAGVLLFAAPVRAEQHLTLTAHVPPAVANGQTPSVGGLPGTEHMTLAISLPLRNEADLDDCCSRSTIPRVQIIVGISVCGSLPSGSARPGTIMMLWSVSLRRMA